MIFRTISSKEYFNWFASHGYDDQVRHELLQYTAADEVLKNIFGFLEENPEATILDVGCGTGYLAEKIRSRFPDVVIIGADISEEMLGKAIDKQVYDLLGEHDFEQESIPFPDDYFDLVVSSGVFDYFRDINFPISEISRVAKERGNICITTYAAHSSRRAAARFFSGLKELAFHGRRWADVKEFVYSPSTVIDCFEKSSRTAMSKPPFQGYVISGRPVMYNLIYTIQLIYFLIQNSHMAHFTAFTGFGFSVEVKVGVWHVQVLVKVADVFWSY